MRPGPGSTTAMISPDPHASSSVSTETRLPGGGGGVGGGSGTTTTSATAAGAGAASTGTAAAATAAGGKPSVADRAATVGLPGRDVRAETLEDAYVSFIFYCTPALPRDADTEALREAFRNPPKSGGKTFDTFAIYELVRRFYGKEIKTWTELTIKLGVEPPDPTKDESSQKVTQYGVRLKKWLNSLHVKSFFEYLMNIPNDYWTKIPNDADPTSQLVRDGVALEDDMALRALLPHIRPKRGRKRPDDAEATPTAAQRMRLSPSATADAVPQPSMMSWARSGDPHLSAHMGFPRSAHPGSGLGPGDGPDGPFSQWPSSAVTPTMRGSFWDDALEPQSAITPTQGKLGRQRRGAKNVSSAWKLGGLDGSGKTRGRPPMNRTPIDGPGNPWTAQPHTATRFNPNLPTPIEQPSPVVSADPHSNSGHNMNSNPNANNNTHPNHLHQQGSSTPTSAAPPPVAGPHPPPRTASAPAMPTAPPPGRTAANNQRPGRPSISLQVPERAGGPVRLATPPPPPPPPRQHQAPPPVVMVNGLETPDETANTATVDSGFSDRWSDIARQTTASLYECADGLPPDQPLSASAGETQYFFEKAEDRTNVDSVMSYFTQQVQESQWFEEDGTADEPACMAEASAIVNATLENMLRTSTSSQAFLINLAALAGAKSLMASVGKCFRLRDDDSFYHYRFEWEYRFGHFRGQFNMVQSVPRSMWKKPPKEGKPGPGEDADGGGGGGLSAEDWQRKYSMLLGEMKKRDREISDLKTKMWTSMQDERG